MSDNKIDNIFKNAASQYSAPAPKASWSKIDSALKKQHKAKLYRNVSVAATFFVAVISSLIITFNVDSVDKHLDRDIQQNETVTNTTIEPKSDMVDVVKQQSYIAANNTVIESNKSENKATIVVEVKPETEANIIVAEETIANNVPIKKEAIQTEERLIIEKVSIIDDVIVERTYNVLQDKEIETADNNIVKDVNSRELIISESIEGNTENTVKNNESVIENAVIENNEENIPNNVEEKKNVQNQQAELETKTSEKEIIVITESESNENTIVNKPKEVIIAKEGLEDIQKVDGDKVKEYKFKEPKSKLIKSLVNNEKVEFVVANSYSVSITNGRGENKIDYDDNLAVALNTKTSFGLAASVDFGIKYNNFIFSAAVRRYDQKTKGDFLVKERNPYNVDAYNYGYTQFGVIKLIQMNTNARLANPSSALYVQDFDKYSVRLRFLEIPLSVAYDYKVNNWSLIPHIGVNPTFLVSNEVKLEKGEDVFMFAEIKDVKKFMLGFSGGVGAYYNISNHWRLGIDADFIYYTGSVNNDATKFNYSPYSLLIGPKVEFKF